MAVPLIFSWKVCAVLTHGSALRLQLKSLCSINPWLSAAVRPSISSNAHPTDEFRLLLWYNLFQLIKLKLQIY